jgi:hypothetical protein
VGSFLTAFPSLKNPLIQNLLKVMPTASRYNHTIGCEGKITILSSENKLLVSLSCRLGIARDTKVSIKKKKCVTLRIGVEEILLSRPVQFNFI